MSAVAQVEDDFEKAYVLDSVVDMPTTFKSAMESSNSVKWKERATRKSTPSAITRHGGWYNYPRVGELSAADGCFGQESQDGEVERF